MQQEANKYLIKLLTKIEAYSLTPDEQKKALRDKAVFIMDKLMRKKFRRRISEDTRKKTFEKVVTRVKKSEPIYLVIPFGGYKHFWNPSHPEPDWAELFHFRWMTEYVLPILAVYSPGVVIEYVSEDLILTRMNNYPERALEEYSKAFHDLIVWYNRQTPKNLEIRYWRVSDKHDKQAIINKVQALLPERKAAFTKLKPEAQELEIHRSLRSVFWNGNEDLSKLTEKEKRERVIESRLVELAFYDTEGSVEFVGEYYWQDNRITLCFSFGLSSDNDVFGDLTIQTAPGSIVDFWIGRGILKHENGKLYGTIVSQKQYQEIKDNLKKVNISTPLVSLRNYQSVEVLNSK